MKKAMLIVLTIGFAFSQSVDIKDDGSNSLITITDEGNAGSITIPNAGTVGAPTANKLYNEGGILKWSGTTLASGGSLWALNGGNVYRSTGNVGIGTDYPTQPLHVAGNMEVDGAIYADDETGVGFYDDAGNLGLWVQDGGKVGIGTITPGASLEIKSTDGSSAMFITNESDVVRFALNTYSDGRWTLLDRHSDTWNYGITQIGGEVGIGTNTPGAKLDINGDIKIVDGTQGDGKVLTSDASGLASWQTPSGSGGTTYSIGDYVLGGIVFWLDSSGEHGLLCHYEDEVGGTSTPLPWCARTDTSFYTMARGNGPFSGEMNTSIIIASQGYGDGSNYAALSCAGQNISDGIKDYGDWYLPSAEELELMWDNRTAINATALSEAGFAFVSNGTYWSSTEHDGNDSFAKILNFSSGNISDAMKIVGHRVRAIRAF